MRLTVLEETYAITSLPGDSQWALARSSYSEFASITRTRDELSVVTSERDAPANGVTSRGWRCFSVDGPLDLSLTGILASLLVPLAEAEVPVFPISTYPTDFILVPESHLHDAITVLRKAGHEVRPA